MPVTITSTSSDGTYAEITLGKTEAGKATIAIKKWKAGKDKKKSPDDEDLIKLYEVRANAEGSKVLCKGDVFGPDPNIAFTFGSQQKPGLTVTVVGAAAKNGTTTYPISADDQVKVEHFISTCGFPAL